MRRSLPLLVGGIGLLLAACSDQGPSPATISPSLRHSVQTGPHFFFLPPLAKSQPNTGAFNPNLAPVVEICRLTGQDGTCTTDPVIRFTTNTPGAFGELITVSTQYQVGWNTANYQLPHYSFWRITVRTAPGGGTVFGFIDLWLAKAANELKNTPPGSVGVLNTSNLPIKFRIEEGALCGDGANCFEGSLGSGGGTFKVDDGTAGLQAPPGAVDAGVSVNLIIERYRGPDPCLPVFDPQYEGCYRYRTEPHIEHFNVPVILGQCLDVAGQAVMGLGELALWKWDEVNESSLKELPAADASAFITCPEELASAATGQKSWLANNLLKPLRSVFGVKPAYAAPRAGPPPIGGGADELSRVGPRRQLSLTKISGDGQSAVIGTSVNPTVKVTSTRTGAPLAGVSIDFTVLTGGGSATTPVVTDAAGIASTTWTLGMTPGANSLRADGNNPRPQWPGQPGIFASVTFTATGVDPIASFLPPIAESNSFGNLQNLSPTVTVCEVIEDACTTTLFSQSATLSVDGSQYQVNWNTPSTLSTLKVYRILVIIGAKTIGYIDVRATEGGQFKTGNYEFNAGQNVPVKFNIHG